MGREEETRNQSLGDKGIDLSGKPVRVLSTSLGVALLANALFIPGASAASGSSADEPTLVSWSTEEVKAYFDKNVDWNIPYPEETGEGTAQPTATPGVATSNGTTVINNYGGYNSGFGWDDLLLYHMLFNSGSSYSPSRWYDHRKTYYGGTRTVYKPRTYDGTRFQNKPVTGSVVKPKTSTSTTGTITRRSTSSKAGGIGGTSSSLGSSSSSSSSRSSSKSSLGSSSRSSSGKASGFGG
ncbi:hypothetical protein J2Z22_000914 [Paenibacillus forsythiae]|uniref:Uncharacterized protein n=2 Tax=Paenibacillus forsythiae TaxID=365616 RepID=A0ABU3H3J7_9BACL|nr:hypothetical protein [Paenibacillus forsythiae]MDT3425398.1 hypothetical protein [Paenibacillus forsythiae]